eukprot:PhF_6_TR27796/c0_g1_i1/m.40493
MMRSGVFLILNTPNLVDSAKRGQNISICPLLTTYFRSVEVILKNYEGKLLWVVGTEFIIEFSNVQRARLAALSVIERLNRLAEPLILPVGVMWAGDIVGRNMGSRFIGVFPQLDDCRQLMLAALPGTVAVDESALLLLKQTPETVVDVSVHPPILTISENEKTDDALAFFVDHASSEDENKSLTSRMLSVPEVGLQLTNRKAPQSTKSYSLIPPPSPNNERVGSVFDVVWKRFTSNPPPIAEDSPCPQNLDSYVSGRNKVSRQYSTFSGHKLSLSQTAPLNVPQDIWDAWRVVDTQGAWELGGEQIYTLITERMGIRITIEQFYEVMQAVDVDGCCLLSLQQFVSAYKGSLLSAFVIRRNIQRASDLLVEQGLDPFNIAVESWNKVDYYNCGSLSITELENVLELMGVPTENVDLKYLCDEFKVDCDSYDEANPMLNLESFLSMFSPPVSQQLLSFQERTQLVSRVMVRNDVESPVQVYRENKVYFAEKLKALFAPALFLYSMYYIIIIPLLFPLRDFSLFTETISLRCTIGLVAHVIPWSWVYCKVFIFPREKHGHLLFDPLEIKIDYLRSTEALCDFIIILPLDAVRLGRDEPWSEVAIVNKMLLLAYVNYFYESSLKRIGVGPVKLRLSKTFLWWLFIIHWCASLFLWVFRSESDEDMYRMTLIQNISGKSIGYVYSQSFDWALKTLVGLSRGDSMPPTDLQILVSLITVLAGVMAYSVIVSAITTALNVRDSGTLFMERLEEVSGFCEYTSGVTEDMKNEMVEFYKHMFSTIGSAQIDDNPLFDIPQELGVRIRVAQIREIMKDISVFYPLLRSNELLHELVGIVTPKIVCPREVICKRGETASAMYHIVKGELWRLSGPMSVSDESMQWSRLGPGDRVGAVCLMYNICHTEEVFGDWYKFTNIIVFNKVQFVDVLQSFPTRFADEMLEATRTEIRRMIRLDPLEAAKTFILDADDISDEIVDQWIASNAPNTNTLPENEGRAAIHRALCEQL